MGRGHHHTQESTQIHSREVETGLGTQHAYIWLLALSIAAVKQPSGCHYDIIAAYLHGNLQETAYMRQAPGFEEGSDLLWKLNKVVHGLKQSARCWNDCLNQNLVELGFDRSTDDPCLYTKGSGDTYMMVVACVDDLLVAGSSTHKPQELANQLDKWFKLKALGQGSNYLGVVQKNS